MWLGCGFLHHVFELFCQFIIFFHDGIVFIVSRFPYFEHVFPIAAEQSLCGLVLHDVASKFVEVNRMGIAEPVVDDYGQVELVLSARLDGEIYGQLHDELVLVKLGAVLVLPDAEVDGQGGEMAFCV
jgi:hypothetical protein